MAITIKQDVAPYTPAYNKVEVSALSTNIAQPAFKYVFEIVTTLFGTFRYDVDPEPTLSHGSQEFGRLLQGFIKESIAQYNSTGGFVQGITNMIVEYHVEYGEQYEVAGVVTDFLDLTTGKTAYVWDAAFKGNDWIIQKNESFPFTTWVMNNAGAGTANQFLTNYKTPKVHLTDLGWTWLLTDTVTDIDYAEIITYDSLGNIIQTVHAANLSAAIKVKSLATSPQSLNNIAGVGSIILGAQPIITAAVDTYTVQVFESTPSVISELLTFSLETECRYETYRIHFLNRLGGFDSYNFTLRSQRSSQAKRLKYTRAETVINSNGITYSHEDIGSLDYYVRSKDLIKLRSDYLTDAENDLLEELINSTNILWETGGLFYPVRMVTKKWVKNKTSIDKLFRLDLDVELSLENTSQRR